MNWSDIKTKVSFINTDTGKYGDIVFIGKTKGEYHYMITYTNAYGLFYQYVKEDTPLPDNYKILAEEEEKGE